MSRQAWGAAAVEAGKRASDIQRRRARREARHAYDVYAAEARYCGYDPEPFEQWTGETTARAAAFERQSFLTFHNMDLY